MRPITPEREPAFLSIQAQDFIEDGALPRLGVCAGVFLSIQAQDFIEESWPSPIRRRRRHS